MTNEELVAEIRRLVSEEDVLKERYRIHDLRVNPNDLPDEYGDYNVVFLFEGKHYYDMNTYMPDEKKFMAESKSMPVIAWARPKRLKEDE